jgi:nitrate reductase NapD
MNISGIIVTAAPGRLQDVATSLAELPGIDVHYQDPDHRRLVVTQEADSVGAEVEGLKRIKAVAGVVYAEMVYHSFEDDGQTGRQWQSELDALGLEEGASCVPDSLRD